MICQIGIAHHRPDPYSTIRQLLNLVEWQSIDVHHLLGSLDVEFHQVNQRCAARYEAHLCSLLCRWRFTTRRDGLGDTTGSAELKLIHTDFSWLRFLPHLLDCSNNVCIGAAPANIAAHQLLNVRVGRTAWLF